MPLSIQILFMIIILISAVSFMSLAPWVPTKKSDRERINKISNLKNGEKLLEVGCGTGGVSLYLAKQNPEAHIVGIEMSPLFYIIAKIRSIFSGYKNISIRFGNALHHDFSRYDYLYVFGLPETISKKLQPKLISEMKTSTKLLSYCFQMTGEEFSEIKYKEEKRVNSIYVYQKK